MFAANRNASLSASQASGIAKLSANSSSISSSNSSSIGSSCCCCSRSERSRSARSRSWRATSVRHHSSRSASFAAVSFTSFASRFSSSARTPAARSIDFFLFEPSPMPMLLKRQLTTILRRSRSRRCRAGRTARLLRPSRDALRLVDAERPRELQRDHHALAPHRPRSLDHDGPLAFHGLHREHAAVFEPPPLALGHVEVLVRRADVLLGLDEDHQRQHASVPSPGALSGFVPSAYTISITSPSRTSICARW